MAVFTLEAVFAKKGDALLLHYGPFENPKTILIDGGPSGVYKQFLKPRLERLHEELELEVDAPIPFELAMVSHVDDDHIKGLIDLLGDMSRAKEQRKPAPYRIKTLWHNSFDDIVDNDEGEIFSRIAARAASASAGGGIALPKLSRESRAVIASTKQGRTLRGAAKKLNIEVNDPFQGLVMAPAARKIKLGHGLTFTIVGPLREQVEGFRDRWDKDLKKILEDESESAQATAFEDDSPFNLASICVFAKLNGKTMLLTGDARGDFVMEGLEQAKVLKKTRPLHVDILKLPHHGSRHNVDDIFFERITANHYVISGNGDHGNPRVEPLEMIRKARGRKRYTIHFTFPKNAHSKETNAKRKKALKAVHDWTRQEKPASCTIVHRGGRKQDLGISIDLLDSFL